MLKIVETPVLQRGLYCISLHYSDRVFTRMHSGASLSAWRCVNCTWVAVSCVSCRWLWSVIWSHCVVFICGRTSSKCCRQRCLINREQAAETSSNFRSGVRIA